MTVKGLAQELHTVRAYSVVTVFNWGARSCTEQLLGPRCPLSQTSPLPYGACPRSFRACAEVLRWQDSEAGHERGCCGSHWAPLQAESLTEVIVQDLTELGVL